MRYRKKPVVIDAEQFVLRRDLQPGMMFMQWPVCMDERERPYLEIPTLEGVMRANETDWIIKGVNGEFYPCKNDIFEKTYERVEG